MKMMVKLFDAQILLCPNITLPQYYFAPILLCPIITLLK